MDDLPRLLKPFYTIEEAFNRLNLAGAGLDKEDDIYLLAAEHTISIHVLLPGPVTLLKESYFQPHYLKSEDSLVFDPGQEAIDVSLEHLNKPEQEVKMEIRDISNPTLMIPKDLFEGDIVDAIDKVELKYSSDEEEKRFALDGGGLQDFVSDDPQNFGSVLNLPAYLDSILSLSSKSFPIPVTLMKANLGWQRGMYGELKEYDFLEESTFGLTSGVNFRNEAYYICEDTDGGDFGEMVRYKVSFKDGSSFRPVYRIKHGLVHRLIKDKCLAITKASIQNFEREHLGVNHELDAIEKPPYLDPNNENYAQELRIAIETHTAIFSHNEGNQNQSRSERVKTWLKKKYPEESAAFYERITTVVLPKKNK